MGKIGLIMSLGVTYFCMLCWNAGWRGRRGV